MERETSHNAGSSFHLERGVQVNQGATATFGAINYHIGQSQPSESSLQDLLKFPEMTYREHAIASVHDGTGRWLLNTVEYLNWAPRERTEQNDREDKWRHRMLWVIGNAGAGKSALMKMAVRHAQSTYRDCLILPHFFNARGTALEKSAEGMYRTLIYWLLDELPSATVQRLRRRLRLPTPINWATPILAELLQKAISELPNQPVLFFVDALDECDEDEVYAMLSVFQGLVKTSQSQQVHACFASRPHPHFGFDGATYLNLSSQEEHNKDINTFVHEKLRIGISPLALDVKQELKEKAQGIFMWVVLVIHTLNSDFNHGNVTKLQQRLRDIPTGLHELFRYTILGQYTTNRDALLICFQWLLFGKDHFQAERLWWAIQRGLGRDDQTICQDYNAMNEKDMQLWIISISRGLIDFNYYDIFDNQNAQFVHESVRDFLFKDTDMLSLYGARNASNLEGRSHEQLRDWCMAERIARRPEILKLAHKGKRLKSWSFWEAGWDSLEQDVAFPFAHYAFSYTMFHTNRAQDGGHDQTSFLEYFVQQTAPSFPVVSDNGYSISFCRSLIGVLLISDCDTLIRETQAQPAQTARESSQAFGLADDFFGSSGLKEAILAGSEAAINELIEIYMQFNYDKRHHVLQSTLQQLAETWQTQSWNLGSAIYAPGGCLLKVATVRPILATFFLIILASPETLIPHLDELHHFTRPSNLAMVAFLQVLHLFFSYKLHSDAIDAADPSSIHWLVWLETAQRTLWYRSYSPEEQQVFVLLCTQLRESIRPLMPP